MKISVKNFQSLAHVEVIAQGLTVIVGRSNLGKSAFIRAVTGALFNRLGDEFVRKGGKVANVSIEELPKSTGGVGHPVVWEKGSGGVNQFTIGTELYTKIGVGSPPLLPGWGYRDVQIDKEYIRPQVAEQHDGLFLLGRAGSFISDVLTMASRLAVLLTANDRCSGDLKRSKQLLKVRQGDVMVASQKLEGMQPILGLQERVTKLKERFEAASALELRRKNIRALLDRQRQLGELLEKQLPPATMVPADLGEKMREVRRLVKEKDRLKTLTPLPEVRVNYEDLITRLEEWRDRTKELKVLTTRRVTVDEQVRRYRAAEKSLSDELYQLTSEIEATREEMKICPVCDQAIPSQKDLNLHLVDSQI